MSLRKLGRYDVVRVLGKGAMGIVYEARDPNLDRRVAIKTVKVENLPPDAADEYEARFRTEARSAARLQHPNIVSVYDSGREGDVAFLVMEYIQGDDLKHHLDSGERFSLEQSLRIIDDLLSALDYAHRHGIVHRDIKPANLLIEASGRVKLTDFGVARIQDAGDGTRTQGAMVGTLKYMSPEQVQGQKIDGRADLFSAGVLLYQLLTDQRPFDGESEFAIIQQIATGTPPAPSSVNARLPAVVDAVVARALAKDREQRYATAREFAEALRAAVRHAEDPTVVPPANPARLGPGGIYLVTSPGGTVPGGTSTVTQELELVYWKDVKDSADPEDLQVFLAKFPAGIYADLARRRLRKLATAPAADQTVLTGMPAPRELAAVATAVEEPPPVVEADEPTRTLPQQRAQAVSVETSLDLRVPTRAPGVGQETTVPVGPPAPQAGERSGAPQPPPAAARGAKVAVLAAVGALAVGAVAALVMIGRGGEQQAAAPQPAASAAAAPAAAASAHAPAAAAVPAAAGREAQPVPAPPAPTAAARHAPASSSQGRASGVAATKVRAAVHGAASAPGAQEAARPAAPPIATSVAVEPRETARAAPPPPRPPASNPADVCRDKIFISRELCLAEQCDKPSAKNHPLCIQRREDAKLREESRVRN